MKKKEYLKSKQSVEKTATIEIFDGVGGLCIYLNDYRICGEKPWGGGKCLKIWKINTDKIMSQLLK